MNKNKNKKEQERKRKRMKSKEVQGGLMSSEWAYARAHKKNSIRVSCGV